MKEQSATTNPVKPRFYLKILNGDGMSFGIRVFLNDNLEQEIFSRFNSGNYDDRKDLFKQFVINENLGLLEFNFDIYHNDRYIGMNWPGEENVKNNPRTQDCRNWIWEYNSMRNRVVSKNPMDDFYNSCKVITRDEPEKASTPLKAKDTYNFQVNSNGQSGCSGGDFPKPQTTVI